MATFVIVVGVPVYAVVFGPESSIEAPAATDDDHGVRSDDRSDLPSRRSDRSRDNTEEPISQLSAAATATGPKVNGRRQPVPIDPSQSGDGTYQVVSGGARAPKGTTGEVVRYMVEVEQGLPFDPKDFASDVRTILNDDRGWGRGGKVRFERVDDGPVRFRVSLSSANQTDDQCRPLRTFGKVSCWNGSRAVINAERWGMGAKTYDDDILSYREYVINHEVGHALGHGHVTCPAEDEPAPIMVQQTKSLEGCRPNPWPYP